MEPEGISACHLWDFWFCLFICPGAGGRVGWPLPPDVLWFYGINWSYSGLDFPWPLPGGPTHRLVFSLAVSEFWRCRNLGLEQIAGVAAGDSIPAST